MEMLDGSWWRIYAWETSGMEENSYCPCCSGEEERLHRQDTLIQFLRRREKRLARMAQVLAVVLLLVISAALALLIALLLGKRAPETPDSQPMMHLERHSFDTSIKQQKWEEDTPSAMLTAPNGNYTGEDHLEWESELGNAHCKGGFNYSSGNLVVPRSGRYKIYLQITYESDSNKCHGDDVIILIYQVFVYQEAYPKAMSLLSSVDTMNCSMKYWIKSLHTDGSFVLEANSRLWVKSSYPQLISKRQQLTFFGAELQTVHVSNT